MKSKDTAPEMAVRRALHHAGLRYSLHRKDLPGRPDIVLTSRHTVVLVHGCHWHSHPGCPRARVPATNQDYWVPKLERNRQRDIAAMEALTGAGWTVHVVWECEIRRHGRLDDLAESIKNAKPRA